MLDLITLEEDYPVFNPEARMLKPFLAIIVRDKGSVGDTQARKKSMATKELAFVWFFANLTSSYNIQLDDEEEREKVIAKDLLLPEKWKRDRVINEAIEYYNNYQETPTSGILQTVRRTLNKSKKVFLFLEGKLDEQLLSLETIDATQARVVEDGVIALITRIMDMSSKLTSQIEILDGLEKKYVKELEEKKGKRNTTIINNYEV